MASVVNDAFPSDLQGWWNTQGEWVEEPNERRSGSSGVQRLNLHGQTLYAKRQVGHIYRSLRYPLGRPTVLRERDALLSAARAGVNVAQIVFCAAEQNPEGWRAILVTKALDGFVTIDQWYAEGQRQRYGEAFHSSVLEQIANTLALLHRSRRQHNCLYAKHIFIRVDEQGAAPRAVIALLDLEKSRLRLSVKQAAMHDMLQLRRHSAWSTEEWQSLISAYQIAMQRSFPELFNAERKRDYRPQ
ncbi:lipopolysaccharide kinase InaA family protein [Pseudomonas sp. 5P_3.1_Bac2]|uniref:lipopolysaccharide kinase InaA family protein n=1 Tax=Pseudomonas sp. 5P_3.1_Bac2 TaxID=2971617 RepID=UPI0021C8109C|nr:lipopolysaccharide kinase InaA family protein [Pseudomonas sp. 5P_3.1_Bac2]MCU1717600.1 InaA protein [Pseudomonas sp. 5P_3.1_Bac2]